jgi:hypothetical protein
LLRFTSIQTGTWYLYFVLSVVCCVETFVTFNYDLFCGSIWRICLDFFFVSNLLASNVTHCGISFEWLVIIIRLYSLSCLQLHYVSSFEWLVIIIRLYSLSCLQLHYVSSFVQTYSVIWNYRTRTSTHFGGIIMIVVIILYAGSFATSRYGELVVG